jgi:hypothetical protein
MTFRVGQKVIRIGSASGNVVGRRLVRDLGFSYPAMGDVVTIKTINDWPTQTVLTFHEHDNSHLIGYSGTLEPGFDAICFRPIQERKTDISFAHEILRKVIRKNRVSA